MNTPQERHEAAIAIAAMRSGSAPKQRNKSRALDVDHYLDEVAIKRLEGGECIEVPSLNLTEPRKTNWNQDSMVGILAGKNNSPFVQSEFKHGSRKDGKQKQTKNKRGDV